MTADEAATGRGREITVGFLHEIIAAFNAHDVERIGTYFAEDAEFRMASGSERDGRLVKGREEICDVLARRFERIPDMHWEPLDDFVAGDRAVSVWHVSGHADDGTVLDHRGCDLWEFQDGLIVRKDTYWKRVE